MLIVDCDGRDFSALGQAFSGEYESDCPLALEVVFADGERIRELNRELRGNDSVTDVLSFPTLEGHCGKPLHKRDYPYDCDENGNLFLGSIVVCEDVARAQAEEYGHSYERELNYLVAHGVCHLLGYDHMQEDDKKIMREKEERVMSRLNLKRD